jgi:uncharacterized membrane protein YwzB
MTNDSKPGDFNWLTRFFLFCAAADISLLNECPKSELNKYVGVGATVVSTGFLASLSGGYAVYTAFHSIWLALALGAFWGLLVFNLDRFIVSTMKKSKNKYKELIQITPRLLLSILLSIVISAPLELKIFEAEINESLYYSEAEKVDQLDAMYLNRIELKNERIDALRNQILEKQDLRDQYYKDYVCECDGTCGTGEKGRGSECERKEQKYNKSDKELIQLKQELESEIKQLKVEKSDLTLQNNQERQALKASIADGLLVRLEALKNLPKGPQISIILLLIAIEIAPILVKLLSPYGPYDHLLRTIEYKFEIDEITSINLRNQQLNNKLTVLANLEQQKVEQEISNNEGAMKLISEAHLELVRDQLRVWLDEEKEKIHQKSKVQE